MAPPSDGILRAAPRPPCPSRRTGAIVGALSTSLPLFGTLILAACAPGDDTVGAAPIWPDTSRSGSGVLVGSADGAALYGVFADEGLVGRVDVATGAATTLAVGAMPSRIARLGDRLVVSLRGERALVVLEDQGGALVEVDRVDTGAEPLGLVVSADGSRVYVALHGQDTVEELDASLTPLRSLPVAGHPSWLALHPSGDTLYVGSVYNGALTWFDLAAGDDVGHPLTIPALHGAGREDDLDFTRRLMGDPAVRPDGGELAVPALWVDNTSPPRHSPEEQQSGDPSLEYDEIGLGLAPTNPGFLLVDLDPATGTPSDAVRLRYATGEGTPVSADTVQVVRGFLSGVAYAPDGSLLAGTMENSRTVVAVDPRGGAEIEGLGGFLDGPLATVVVGEGPRGLWWDARGAWALNAFDRSVSPLPLTAITAGLEAEEGGYTMLLAADALPVAAPVLDATLTEGRLLFSTAVLPQMATPAAGVSCSTCHLDSRNDGLSWPDYDTILRQTKSLAGPMSPTAPFTWTETVETVADEARITSEYRLGGRNATQEELDAVAAWIDHTPAADHTDRGLDTDAVRRGAAIFARADVGCALCHTGEHYTDQLPHDLYGLEHVDTPQLVGIAATPPYLHDGSAATLRDVLESAAAREMGDTSGLSPSEMDDLEAFLRSL